MSEGLCSESGLEFRVSGIRDNADRVQGLRGSGSGFEGLQISGLRSLRECPIPDIPHLYLGLLVDSWL
jgi:hypothetical protein